MFPAVDWESCHHEWARLDSVLIENNLIDASQLSWQPGGNIKVLTPVQESKSV